MNISFSIYQISHEYCNMGLILKYRYKSSTLYISMLEYAHIFHSLPVDKVNINKGQRKSNRKGTRNYQVS